MSFNSAGILSGTPAPGSAGTYSGIVFEAVDTATNSTASIGPLDIRVFGPVHLSDVSIGAYVGETLNSPISGGGGRAPYVTEVISGSLPAGISVDGLSVRGAASEAGQFTAGIRLRDTNGRQANALIDVEVVTGMSVTGSFLDAYAGDAYRSELSVAGGYAPHTWSLQPDGNWPSELSLVGNEISGTPVAAGTYSATVRVTDRTDQFEELPVTVNVYDPPVLADAPEQEAYVGDSPSFDAPLSGGKTPLLWSVSSGDLPDGMSLDNSTGTISGVPTEPGSFTPTISVSDANSRQASVELSVSVWERPALPDDAFMPAYAQHPYNHPVNFSGGKAPFNWQVLAGDFPDGMYFNPSDGTIGGFPQEAGESQVTVRVSDANGIQATETLSFVVLPPLALEQASIPDAYVDEAYTFQLSASGGKAPYSYGTIGQAPSWLTVGADGTVSGMPTATETTNVYFSVRDANGMDSFRIIPVNVVQRP